MDRISGKFARLSASVLLLGLITAGLTGCTPKSSDQTSQGSAEAAKIEGDKNLTPEEKAKKMDALAAENGNGIPSMRPASAPAASSATPAPPPGPKK